MKGEDGSKFNYDDNLVDENDNDDDLDDERDNVADYKFNATSSLQVSKQRKADHNVDFKQ
jgi:hypothetical protein